MKALGFIPARMASTRYPGKPLAPIAGRPMLEHCWHGASSSTLIDEVQVATCDEEIAAWAREAGIGCMMTSDRHVRATDRAAEATASTDADAVVLVQTSIGDLKRRAMSGVLDALERVRTPGYLPRINTGD